MTTRRRERLIDQDVREAIYAGVRAGQSASELHRHLLKNPEFEDRVPQLRTMQRIVNDIRKRLTPLDEAFQWHRLPDYDLPWEASSFLLGMCAFFSEEEMYPSDGGGGKLFPVDEFAMYLPSAREACWWWRIHLADPDLEMYAVWHLAQAFVARELAAVLLDMPLEMADLEALLAYRPWADDDKLRVYQQAVRDRRTPPVKRLSRDKAGLLYRKLVTEGNRRYFLAIVGATDPAPFIPR